MTTFSGTSGDDTFTAAVGNDTYQLGNGNDTIYFNATVNAPLVVNQPGVLNWTNGFDTVISTDGGVAAPNYDRIVLNFSDDYLYARKVGANLELSVYAHAPNSDADPGTVDQVGKITLTNAFTASAADRIGKIEGANFSFEAIAAPAADSYGHTAIYKIHHPRSGSVEFTERYIDINFKTTQSITKYADGSAIVQQFDSNANQLWSNIDITYSNYGTATQTLHRSQYYAHDGSMSVSDYGTAGNDSLSGGIGNDMLSGGAGSDTVNGGAGNDTVDGGAVLDNLLGSDWNFITYGYATAGVNINLSGITGNGSTGSGTASGDASVGVDTLKNINLIQGSNFNDTITGSSALILEQFEGGGGNDTINGGAITDLRNGENDNRITYHSATGAGVTVDLRAGTAVGAAGSNVGSDTLINFDQVRGSNFKDWLFGSNRTDLTEQFEGRAGDDYIDGRGGFDIVRYSSATTQVVVDLVTGRATGAMGNDTLVGIEGARGGSGNDILKGGNALNGVNVNDGLSEVFRGEAGNDTIDGGQGYDRVDYTSSTAGVLVVLNGTLDGSASDGLGGTDVLRHIEGVRGSAFNDSLTGSAAAFESFEGREGRDTINGGGGVDRADYQNSKAGVSVSLATGLASDGYGSIDTLSNIENVRGSIGFADTITGSAANNNLEGLGGNDILSGGAGNDTLVGGLGADRLTGGTGTDHFVFNAPAETGLTSATMDTIADFKTSEGDKINLLGIDANATVAGNQAFTFLGAVSAFTGNATGQLRFDAVSHILYGSTDADTAAEFAIVVTGVTSLAAANFVL